MFAQRQRPIHFATEGLLSLIASAGTAESGVNVGQAPMLALFRAITGVDREIWWENELLPFALPLDVPDRELDLGANLIDGQIGRARDLLVYIALQTCIEREGSK
ncbi:MAG TPA: hypothetical protein VGK77_14800 [Candidatus Binatia bacterium]|jgi:hypothetical protein